MPTAGSRVLGRAHWILEHQRLDSEASFFRVMRYLQDALLEFEISESDVPGSCQADQQGYCHNCLEKYEPCACRCKVTEESLLN